LQIQVLLPDNKHATGKLQHHNLHYNIAVVSIEDLCGIPMAKLHTEEPVVPPSEVVAIGRTFETGKLMATSGVLTDNSSNFISKEHGISTCKITKVHHIGFTSEFA
jgi:S1-C subfamily serine protease